MDVFIGRQGIYNRNKQIIAYEILYRNSYNNTYDKAVSSNQATRKVIYNLTSAGINTITDGKTSFINFPQDIIENDIDELLLEKDIVVEVLEDVKPTDTVIEKLKLLKEHGFKIALDDVDEFSKISLLIDISDIVKIDFKLTNKDSRHKLIKELKKYNVKYLAEKIENEDEYREALNDGYSYFQGYYFSKPSVIEQKDLQVNKRICFSIVTELIKEDFDIDFVENLIKSDASMSLKLMRFLNSGYFSFVEPIKSVRQAIMLLGKESLRKWAAVISMQSLDSNEEYYSNTMICAKLCELIDQKINNIKVSKAFIVGLFSELNVIMGTSMESILSSIKVDAEIKDALLGKDNYLFDILSLAKSYRRFDIGKIEKYCRKLSIENSVLENIYLKAVKWQFNLISKIEKK